MRCRTCSPVQAFSLVQYARRRRDDETFLALSTCSHAVQIELAVRGGRPGRIRHEAGHWAGKRKHSP